jgi:polysaccharide export outer membrane protein
MWLSSRSGSMHFVTRSLVLLLGALLLHPTAAAAQTGIPPAASGDSARAVAAPDTVWATHTSGAQSADARIRPGDQVTVRIFREPDLGGVFTVSAAGDVVLPRLGRLGVTELTAPALQDSLVRAYGEYLRNPSIEVVVLRRIGVQGEVRRPDSYMVDLTVTLRDLIARAGGVTEAGNPNGIVIVRGAERIEVDEADSGRFSAAELYSGDQVVVGRRSWMALNPAVAAGTAMSIVSFLIGLMTLLNK